MPSNRIIGWLKQLHSPSKEGVIFTTQWFGIILGFVSIVGFVATLCSVRSDLSERQARLEKAEADLEQQKSSFEKEKEKRLETYEIELEERFKGEQKKREEEKKLSALDDALAIGKGETGRERIERILSLDKYYAEMPDQAGRITEAIVEFLRETVPRSKMDKITPEVVSIPEDVQMALSVLASRPQVTGDKAPLDLSGLFLRGVDLEQGKLSKANLTGSDLRDANLRNANLSRALLKEALLVGAHMEEVILEWAFVDGADLQKANASAARMSNVSLTTATLDKAVLERANLENANLEDCFARKTDFSSATLKGARFIRARLEGAELVEIIEGEGAKFSWARMEKAKLSYSSFRKADFRGAVMTGASVLNTNVAQAVFANATCDKVSLAEFKNLTKKQVKSMKKYDSDKVPENLK